MIIFLEVSPFLDKSWSSSKMLFSAMFSSVFFSAITFHKEILSSARSFAVQKKKRKKINPFELLLKLPRFPAWMRTEKAITRASVRCHFVHIPHIILAFSYSLKSMAPFSLRRESSRSKISFSCSSVRAFNLVIKSVISNHLFIQNPRFLRDCRCRF